MNANTHLIKQGEISSYYDIDYTYYRDTQLDIEVAQGQLYQLTCSGKCNT